ncbi:class I glutamine amidotransferase-like protein [Absidia repens]|uniref:Class I glutamine amidotransferase-like protein n=1 Tax=Absidia repens TaxID=90262 RepID=A0A1X2J168_9FUNG|nr:class I glutamine amidotransferase-like protein [Absidia repens]
MKQQLRIAVLVTAVADPAISSKHGTFFDMFNQVFQQALVDSRHNDKTAIYQNEKDILAMNLDLDFVPFDVVHDPPHYPTMTDIDTGKYHGIIITGSTDTAAANTPWTLQLIQFIKDLQLPKQQQQQQQHRFKVPLIGVCYGHQIIARALGGTCERNPNGWEFGPTTIHLTPQGQSYLQTGDKTTMCLNQIHEDYVPSLPAGFLRLATTEPHTSIQAMVSTDGRCITVQGHPEIPCDATATFLDRLSSCIPHTVVQDARSRLDNHSAQHMDDLWFAGKLLRFLLGQLPSPSSSSLNGDEQAVPSIPLSNI